MPVTIPFALQGWAARWSLPAECLADLLQCMGVGVVPPEPPTPAPPQATEEFSGSEAGLQSLIRVEAPKLGITLWRNNSGALVDNTGRLLRFGLGNESAQINRVLKSSDLIGIGPQGRFVAVEVKAPGWTKPKNEREKAQKNFIDLVNGRGGRAIFCSNLSQLKNLLAP